MNNPGNNPNRQGKGQGNGQGQGRCRGGGPVVECICPKCNATIPHQPGVPCHQASCPQCGNQMIGKRN